MQKVHSIIETSMQTSPTKPANQTMSQDNKCPIDHSQYSNRDVSSAVSAANRHQKDRAASTNEQEEKCPVIHAVTDSGDDDAATTTTTTETKESYHGSGGYHGGKYRAANGGAAKETAFPADAETEEASPFDFEREFEDEVPSMRQYKKLKRTVGMITDFYRSGTVAKENNYQTALDDLARLEIDARMVEEQMTKLMAHPKYKGHLKWKDIKEELESEELAMKNQKKVIEEHAEKCRGLHEWSTGIVKICEWLEVNLDNYCSRYLDLPKNIVSKMEEVPELSTEEGEHYSKGLDEIMHNLNESRDFFQAAVDGRLDTYYEIEKQMLEEQLEVLKGFPEGNPRREYVESSLRDDLEHAEAQLESSQEEKTQTRREFMLDLHLNFLKVLTFFKERLKLLNATDREKREYDATFTTTFVLDGSEKTAEAE